VYDKQNRKNEALEAFYRSIAIAEAKEDSASMMMTYINVNILERRNFNIDKAIKGFSYGVNFFENRKDTLNAAICHHNLSSIYLDKKQSAAFIYHIDKAIQGYQYSNDKLGYAYILLNKAQGYALLKDYLKAEQTIMTALNLAETNNFNDLISYLKNLSLDISIARGTQLEQMPEQLKALQQYADTSAVWLANNIRRTQILYYARTGQYEAFQTAFEAFAALQEQENEAYTKGIFEEIQTIYAIDKLNLEKIKLSDSVKAQKKWILSLISISILLSLLLTIIVVLYYRLQFRTRALFRINTELAFGVPVIPIGSVEKDALELSGEIDVEENPLSNLYNNILYKHEKDKPYLDPQFNLPVFSAAINRSERYISQAINQIGNTNFNKIVNHFRINEARRLITSQGMSMSLHEVAEKSGFSNRVTFYRNFKDETGLSPKEYLERVVQERPGAPNEE
jgi:AraC-like DNA-binding protein